MPQLAVVLAGVAYLPPFPAVATVPAPSAAFGSFPVGWAVAFWAFLSFWAIVACQR